MNNTALSTKSAETETKWGADVPRERDKIVTIRNPISGSLLSLRDNQD